MTRIAKLAVLSGAFGFFAMPAVVLSNSAQEFLYQRFTKARYWWHSLKPSSMQVDGETLAYFDTKSPRYTKSQGEPILLLHGFTADKETWLGMVGRLGRKHRLIALDLGGHGHTSKAADDNYRIARQAKRAHEFVQKLDPRIGPHHVLGHSMGGAVAIAYAIDENPGGVLSLGLIAPAAAKDLHTDEFNDLKEGKSKTKPFLKINPLIVSKDDDSVVEWSGFEKVQYVTNGPQWLHWVSRCFNSYLTKSELERTSLYEDIFRQLSGGGEAPFTDDEFKKIRCPTFILWGTEDRVLTPNVCYITSRVDPEIRVEFEQWGGVGHSPNIERPARTAKAYLKFLERTRSRL